MVSQWDIVVRLVAVGASTMLLALLIAGPVRRALRLPLIGLLLGAIAYLLNSSGRLEWLGALRHLVDLVSLLTPMWTWLFARTLFEREPPRALLAALLVLLVGLWGIAHYSPQLGRAGFYGIHLASLALVVDLFRVAWDERADDLVEKRRLIRLWLPLLVGAQAGGILLYETVMGYSAQFAPVQLINALLILALTLFSGIALLRTDPELLVETEADHPRPEPVSDLSPADLVLQDKLAAAMAAGYYRTPGLTIAGLAAHLGTQEHRLRALINRRLGHRNFASFLNRHRIAEAQAILADRARVELPVLTIAMDLGYNALATFNRAFRAETGQTPTDFRRAAIGASPDQN